MALDSVLSTPMIPLAPKGATAPAGGTSSAGSSTSASGSDGSGSSSSSASTSSAAGSSKSASTTTHSTRSSARGNGKSDAGQAPNASSASNKARQKNATNPAQRAAAASSTRDAAAQNKNQGPSFIQALAQTQADAQDSATATVAAAPQEFTNTKPKGPKNDPDTIGTALGFLPQSLAAAMAGLQPASAGQNLPANTPSDDDSTDAVSLKGGAAIEDAIANMAQDTAEELAHGTAGLKAATDTKADPSPTSATDTTAAAAANAFQAHMASRAPALPNADKIATPVGNTGFADEVGEKITWMAHQGMQSASLQMAPEHLGPVEVRISMQQDGTASVSFTAAHAETRTALEQALPQLREMFSNQGLTLTDASVSHQSPRGQAQQRQAVNAIGAIGGGSGEGPTSSTASVTRVQSGLLDTYA